MLRGWILSSESRNSLLVLHEAGHAQRGSAIPGVEDASSLESVLGALAGLSAVIVEPGENVEALDLARLEGIRATCTQQGVALAVEMPLGPDADAFAVFGSEPTSLAAVLEVTRRLREAGLLVRWRIPLIPELVLRLEGLYSLARDEGVDPVLAPPGPENAPATIEDLDPDQRQFLWDFVTYRLLDEERERLPPARIGCFEALAAGLRDVDDWTLRCRAREVALHAWPGDRPGTWTLRGEDRSALALAAGDTVLEGEERFPAAPFPAGVARAVETAGVFYEGAMALFQWVLARLAAPLRKLGAKRDEAQPRALDRVLVIGAYGGEHIGDAAILGGVLLRNHARFGIRSAILMSQRPEHTRHLVPMLELPVEIEVDEHDQSRIARRMPEVDGVIFAGGPLMDIPKQLVKHFYAVSLADRQGKPFIVEGIGSGPFLLAVSEWVARRLIRMASRITVRTKTDGAHRLVSDLKPGIDRDPAFDYLASRPTELTRLPEPDREWLETLLRDTGGGRPTIAINLRPIRHIYTVASAGDDPAAYTRAVEAEFERRFANALRRFDEACTERPCFVFYTMNGIQFGSSDLRSAYRVGRLLGGDLDYRVWQADPSLDGVVALLRRADLAIAMRFHGAIFALSQDLPVVGIDYRIGKRDKVHALLEDFGQSENCRRVDELEEDWLTERLVSLARARS